MQAARDAPRYGLPATEIAVDLARVLDQVHDVQQTIYDDADSPEVVSASGVDLRAGEAIFTDAHTVVITGAQGASRPLRFRWCVVATGSRPRIPEIAGLQEVEYLTNETLFQLARLPRRMIVVGGGPIGSRWRRRSSAWEAR